MRRQILCLSTVSLLGSVLAACGTTSGTTGVSSSSATTAAASTTQGATSGTTGATASSTTGVASTGRPTTGVSGTTGATATGGATAVGTTSGGCAVVGASCASSRCCAGSVCAPSSDLCVASSTTSAGTTTSTATSTATATTSGAASTTGSSATTSGGGYAGGCDSSDFYESQFEPCAQVTDCDCSQICASDSSTLLTELGGQGHYCEAPCSTSADCPDPATFCANGSCTYDVCTSLYASCGVSSPNAGDGYCLPYDFSGTEGDLCTFNGTLTTGQTCTPFGTFALPTGANCVAGEVCYETTSSCVVACSPDGPPSCTGGTSCVSLQELPDMGVCK